jgi:predicted nucleotidyltransferase
MTSNDAAEVAAPPTREEVDRWITILVCAAPGIREIWLFGSRAQGTETPKSDWDLLAFANSHTIIELSKRHDLAKAGIDLFVDPIEIRDDRDRLRAEIRDPFDLNRALARGVLQFRKSDSVAVYRYQPEDGSRHLDQDHQALLIWKRA